MCCIRIVYLCAKSPHSPFLNVYASAVGKYTQTLPLPPRAPKKYTHAGISPAGVLVDSRGLAGRRFLLFPIRFIPSRAFVLCFTKTPFVPPREDNKTRPVHNVQIRGFVAGAVFKFYVR